MQGGIVRRTDELGRVVLPTSVRQLMGLYPGTPVEFLVDEDRIVLRRARLSSCAICAGAEDLVNVGSELVCRTCLRKLVGVES